MGLERFNQSQCNGSSEFVTVAQAGPGSGQRPEGTFCLTWKSQPLAWCVNSGERDGPACKTCLWVDTGLLSLRFRMLC